FITLVGARRGLKLNVMAVRTVVTIGCRLTAIAKPAGMRKRLKAPKKAGNVCSAGNIANLMAAAQTTAPATPSANARAPPYARSPFGESNRTRTARNTIVEAPFGQAVATQKSSAAPIARNARAALSR